MKEKITLKEFSETIVQEGKIGLIYERNEYYDLLVHISEKTKKSTYIPVPIVIQGYGTELELMTISNEPRDWAERMDVIKENGIDVNFAVQKGKWLKRKLESNPEVFL